VGAVRRNFVRTRTTTTTDKGMLQTCDMACREFGKDYEPTYQGRALNFVEQAGELGFGLADVVGLDHA